MKEFTTAQRLQTIMSERNLKQVDILQKTAPFCKKYGIRIAKNDLSQYISGKVEPRQDKLTVLGLALNVSEAWLMGYNVPMEREVPIPDNGNEHMSRLVELAACLTEEEQEEIISMIEWKLSKR